MNRGDKPYCLETYSEDVIKGLAENMGFSEIKLKYQSNYGSNIGIQRLTFIIQITGVRAGKLETFSIFVKRATSDERVRQHTMIAKSFEREICFYRNLLPEMKNILEGYKEKTYLNFPKFYGAYEDVPNEYFLMENINDKGFEIDGGIGSLNESKRILAIKYLAHFHGISFVMKEKKPNLFKSFADTLEDYTLCDTLQSKVMMQYVKFLIDNVQNLPVNGDKKTFYRTKGQEILNVYKVCMTPTKYSIFTHGDYHKFNMLFGLNNADEPAMYVIDYQYLRYVSPVTDLVMFIFSSTNSREVLRNDLPKLLELYYTTLKEFLFSFSYDITDIYPHHVFQEEWRTMSPWALIISNVIVVQNCCFYANEDPVDLVDMLLGNIPTKVLENVSDEALAVFNNIAEYFMDNKLF